MRAPLILLIRVYQRTISPLLGPTCRYEPSCSRYAVEAIEVYGAWRGTRLAIGRLGRCHPGRPGGYDPVPARVPDNLAAATAHTRGLDGDN